MVKINKSTLAIVAMGVISIVIGVLAQKSERQPKALPEFKSTVILPSPKPLTGVQFTTHNNQPFTRDDLLGTWTILFPGFTNCPDICPTTMHTLKSVKAAMLETNKWGNYQVAMLTVDPKRDTVEKLAKYIPFFDSEFIGLTADEKLTETFAKQVGVLFFARDDGESENYEVDHSAAIILINPKGEWAGAITAPHKADEIIYDLSALAAFYASDHTPPHKTEVSKNNSALTSEQIEYDGELLFENAWVRPAPETANSMAAYFTLHNNSDEQLKIVSASSPQFKHVSIHNTLFDNGIAKMLPVAELLVQPRSRVNLTPLATHIMLMQPKSFQPVGSEILIEFLTSDGKTISSRIKVKPQPYN